MVFDSVICGIDASPEGLEAARQAARLMPPEGRLLLVVVTDVNVAVHAGYAAADVLDRLRRDSAAALEGAVREVSALHPVESRLLEGTPSRLLKETIEQEGGTLLCVGSHGYRRAAGILIGSIATTLLHEAPCSVLVARPPGDPVRFPRRVVAGVDGSPCSLQALAVAKELCDRLGVELEVVLASGTRNVEADAATLSHPDVTVDPRAPIPALLAAAADADLLVVGSRGLHGLRALGSVSERVAHEARCSVLVVR
jgi:nucleotide-binding universal stress UspA family protein